MNALSSITTKELSMLSLKRRSISHSNLTADLNLIQVWSVLLERSLQKSSMLH